MPISCLFCHCPIFFFLLQFTLVSFHESQVLCRGGSITFSFGIFFSFKIASHLFYLPRLTCLLILSPVNRILTMVAYLAIKKCNPVKSHVNKCKTCSICILCRDIYLLDKVFFSKNTECKSHKKDVTWKILNIFCKKKKKK